MQPLNTKTRKARKEKQRRVQIFLLPFQTSTFHIQLQLQLQLQRQLDKKTSKCLHRRIADNAALNLLLQDACRNAMQFPAAHRIQPPPSFKMKQLRLKAMALLGEVFHLLHR
jgi:hypothetical protein